MATGTATNRTNITLPADVSGEILQKMQDLAGECAEWFFTDALYRDSYKNEVEQNKYDDSFWFDFIQEAHSEVRVTNIAPNIVDHVDFLLGGSVLHRREDTARSSWWEDDAAFRRLENIIDKIAP